LVEGFSGPGRPGWPTALSPRVYAVLMTPRNHISGTRPVGCEPVDAVIVRIPHAATPEDHADVRRKLAAGWKLGEICGEADSLFKYAYIYPATPASAPTD
jgi:hypothetical protein